MPRGIGVDHVVEHNGCPIHYNVSGSGPVVLFIQGVGVHGGGWRPQVDALASEYACITCDNRGVGRSVPSGAPITVEQMADDARAVLDAQDVGEAHVVGHSLGGLVALQLALSHPDRVRSLSLLCTFASGREAAPLTPRMLWLGMRARVGTRRMRRRGFLGIVMPPGAIADPEKVADDMAALFGHDLGDQEPVTGAQLAAMRASDLRPRLHELAGLPTLVVSAASDPIAPPTAGRRMADSIQGATFVEAAGASHGLPITHSDWTNGLLADHFAASATAGPSDNSRPTHAGFRWTESPSGRGR